MARREQNHQISHRDRALDSEINYRLLTLLAAFLIVFTMVVGTIYLASTNHEKAAIALGAASGLTLLAGAFLRGRDLFPKSEPPKPPASKPPTAPRPRAAQRRPKR